MKYATVWKRLSTATLVLLLITAVIAPISQYMDTTIGGKESLRGGKDVAVYLLLAGAMWVSYKHSSKQFKVWLNRPVVRIALAFVGLNVIYTLWSAEPLAAQLAGLLFNTRFAAWFLLLLLLADSTVGFGERYKKTLVALCWFLVAFALVQIFILPADFFSFVGYEYPSGLPYQTVDNDPSLPRYAATTRGPNELASFLLVGLTVLAGYVLEKKRFLRDCSLLMAGFLTLFFTYSRSAQLGLVVSLGILSYFLVKKKSYLLLGLAGVVVLGVVAVGLSGQSQTLQRILFHDENNSQEIDSNDQRLAQLDRTVEMVTDQPQGHGVGSAGPASFYGDDPFIPDNYYAQLAVELGIAGLLLFVGFYGYVLKELFGHDPMAFAAGVGLLLVGMFAHVWADDLTAYAWWGLAAVGLSQKPRRSAII